MRNPCPPLLLALVAASTGCALVTHDGEGARHDSRVLTTEELRASTATYALELIRKDRPQWLVTRGTTTLRGSPPRRSRDGDPGAGPILLVYIDGVRYGTVEELRDLRLEAIAEIRLLSPGEATNRFGTNHAGGAILVTLAL